MDFCARKIDRDALTQLLKDTSDTPVVAVSDIPNNKTILERFIPEALNEEEVSDETDKKAWLSKATKSAEKCASLSAIDLVELGR